MYCIYMYFIATVNIHVVEHSHLNKCSNQV